MLVRPFSNFDLLSDPTSTSFFMFCVRGRTFVHCVEIGCELSLHFCAKCFSFRSQLSPLRQIMLRFLSISLLVISSHVSMEICPPSLPGGLLPSCVRISVPISALPPFTFSLSHHVLRTRFNSWQFFSFVGRTVFSDVCHSSLLSSLPSSLEDQGYRHPFVIHLPSLCSLHSVCVL